MRFGPGLNVIHGQNAQGKTNLLEAIATLALTRSPRTTSSGDLLLWSRGCGTRRGRCRASTGRRHACPSDFSVTSQPDGSAGSRQSTASRAPARAMLGVCPVVLFWPEDLALVRGGPEGRRRFLDVILAQTDPQAVAHMSRYRRVLEQRNALLHQLRAGRRRTRFAAAASRASSPITAHGWRWRGRASSTRSRRWRRSSLHDLSGQREQHRASLRTGACRRDSRHRRGRRAGAPRNAAHRRMAEEIARGVTLAGPHRDDVAFDLDGRAGARDRFAGSAAQHRARVQARRGPLPPGHGGRRSGHPSRRRAQ